jgi:sarcosine oxidase subunit beta
MKQVPIVRTWAGIEGIMPDKLPVIGPGAAAPGVFHAFGFSAHGLQLAPIVGQVMADLLSRGRCDFDLAPFAADRFADGAGRPFPDAASAASDPPVKGDRRSGA